MPEVAFHTGLAEPTAYACRLLRKAARQGARVAVWAPEGTLARLDVALWVFDPLDFLPHAHLRGANVPRTASRAPIWLLDDPARAAHREVLVRLGDVGDALPAGHGDWSRIVELVDASEPAREAARRRWRAYGAAGCSVRHHPQDGG